MKTVFTKEFMEKNCGCYSKQELYACSFMQNGDSIYLSDILESGVPLKDKFWFVIKKCATKEEEVAIAIECAECVLPIYEELYPNDIRVRNAVEAAKKYIIGEISLAKLLGKKASASAAAAYYAAEAAAAYAASAAAYAASASAYAAADAAADAAAAAAAYKENLLYILKSKLPSKDPQSRWFFKLK